MTRKSWWQCWSQEAQRLREDGWFRREGAFSSSSGAQPAAAHTEPGPAPDAPAAVESEVVESGPTEVSVSDGQNLTSDSANARSGGSRSGRRGWSTAEWKDWKKQWTASEWKEWNKNKKG